MSDIIFHNKPFELQRMKIPEFELRKGEMVRIYVPNFSKENEPLGGDFAHQLAEVFQKLNPNFFNRIHADQADGENFSIE